MSSEPNSDGEFVDQPQSDPVLRETLIRCCGLDESAIAKIEHSARLLGVDFAEAAIRTGFVTEEDLEYAKQLGREGKLVQVRRAKPGPLLRISSDPFDPRNEQLLGLRTELLLRHEGVSRANMIAILSPESGEGRSQLSAELAISFAQLGHPTLLVDADLRKPRHHELFETTNEQGLSTALARRGSAPLSIIEGFAHLSLLPAGPQPTNPLELLSSGHFERMVSDWRQSYEFVVIDTPPVCQVSDALAVATLVGRVLSVSRAHRTSFKQQREMLRRLAVTRASVLGGVINNF